MTKMNEPTSLVIGTLKEAAAALQDKDKLSAMKLLAGISGDVAGYRRTALQAEQEARSAQQAVTEQVGELIRKQGQARADFNKATKDVEAINNEIVSKRVSIQDLNNRIGNNTQQLHAYERELRQCQARMDDLNDKSAGSIILSILCLGLDRAIKAIGIEIDGVRHKIEGVKQTIARYSRELSTLQDQLWEDQQRLQQAEKAAEQQRKLLKNLEFTEFRFHSQEAMQRSRMTFFTELNMFYMKVQLLLNNIEHRVDDVLDIVAELDAQRPTIASFDPTCKDLLSLQDAIILFEEHAGNVKQLQSFEPVFEEQNWYYVTSEWQGVERPLTVYAEQDKLHIAMADKKGGPGQRWKVKQRGNGYYQLINELATEERSLAAIHDGLLNMDATGNYSGQYWKVDPEFGYCRLYTMWLGEFMSLDIVNDGKNNRLKMADSGNYSGQHWRFIPAN
jgi:predicted  nucleic acid-binding Zn-ribbon protein